MIVTCRYHNPRDQHSEWWLHVHEAVECTASSGGSNSTFAAEENFTPTTACLPPDPPRSRICAVHLTVDFNYMKRSCKSAHRNMCSASENPEVVEEFLQSKQAVALMVQVPELESIKGLQTSPFGVIPKTHQSGQPQKWRLIVDLSAPRGRV